MIHSLSGGQLKINKNYDFAKVEILEGESASLAFWFISPFKELKEGQIVVVLFGRENKEVKGKVLRIDRNVNEQSSPFPIKRMKKIVNILDWMT